MVVLKITYNMAEGFDLRERLEFLDLDLTDSNISVDYINDSIAWTFKVPKKLAELIENMAVFLNGYEEYFKLQSGLEIHEEK